MSFFSSLLGYNDPYSGRIGAAVFRITEPGSRDNKDPDWMLIMDVCDTISGRTRSNDSSAEEEAVAAIERRFQESCNGVVALDQEQHNERIINLALTLLEACFKNCGISFVRQVHNKKTIISYLTGIAKLELSRDVTNSFECCRMIQELGIAYEGKQYQLPKFSQTYKQLKSIGVIFPVDEDDETECNDEVVESNRRSSFNMYDNHSHRESIMATNRDREIDRETESEEKYPPTTQTHAWAETQAGAFDATADATGATKALDDRRGSISRAATGSGSDGSMHPELDSEVETEVTLGLYSYSPYNSTPGSNPSASAYVPPLLFSQAAQEEDLFASLASTVGGINTTSLLGLDISDSPLSSFVPNASRPMEAMEALLRQQEQEQLFTLTLGNGDNGGNRLIEFDTARSSSGSDSEAGADVTGSGSAAPGDGEEREGRANLPESERTREAVQEVAATSANPFDSDSDSTEGEGDGAVSQATKATFSTNDNPNHASVSVSQLETTSVSVSAAAALFERLESSVQDTAESLRKVKVESENENGIAGILESESESGSSGSRFYGPLEGRRDNEKKKEKAWAAQLCAPFEGSGLALSNAGEFAALEQQVRTTNHYSTIRLFDYSGLPLNRLRLRIRL